MRGCRRRSQYFRLRLEARNRLVTFTWIGEPIKHLLDRIDAPIITDCLEDRPLPAFFDDARDVIARSGVVQDNIVTTMLAEPGATEVRLVTLGAEDLLYVGHRQTCTGCDRHHCASLVG
jgi:hypothetical protein